MHDERISSTLSPPFSSSSSSSHSSFIPCTSSRTSSTSLRAVASLCTPPKRVWTLLTRPTPSHQTFDCSLGLGVGREGAHQAKWDATYHWVLAPPLPNDLGTCAFVFLVCLETAASWQLCIEHTNHYHCQTVRLGAAPAARLEDRFLPEQDEEKNKHH